MQISPILQSYRYNFVQPSFTSYKKTVLDKNGLLKYRTNTALFRNDLNWRNFVEFLNKNYKNTEQVNIVCHACSNGSEAFSLVAALLSGLQEKAKKFFPIKAKDIDTENIELAEEGYLPINRIEKEATSYYLGDKFNNYFDIESSFFIPAEMYLIPKPHLKENIVFERADLLKDIDNLPHKNTILMCRNMWPYLSTKEQETLVQKFVSEFDNTCLFVIGKFDVKNDANCNIENVFRKYGLCKTEIDNVWYNPNKISFVA